MCALTMHMKFIRIRHIQTEHIIANVANFDRNSIIKKCV